MAFSVNTNVGAMVALQSFAAARSRLDSVTSQVATGLRIMGPVDNAADFAIAQGVRSEIKAWGAVGTALGGARGLVGVTIAATTQISNLLGQLKKQVLEYFAATNAQSQPALQDAVNQTLGEIDLAAQSATYNGTNLITTNEAPSPSPPPGQGQTFSLTGNASSTQALGGTAGQLIVNFNQSSGGGFGAMTLSYNGSVVAFAPIGGGQKSGSLVFNYPATTSTDVTVQLVSFGGMSVNFSFLLNFPPPSGSAAGSYQVTSDIQGTTISVQHRSMLTQDLGFSSGFLSSQTGALAQIDAAEQVVSTNLGYYGAAANQIQAATDGAQRFQDALTQGLGSLVDANLQQQSAVLAADQVRQTLVLQSLSIANSEPSVLISLLTH